MHWGCTRVTFSICTPHVIQIFIHTWKSNNRKSEFQVRFEVELWSRALLFNVHPFLSFVTSLLSPSALSSLHDLPLVLFPLQVLAITSKLKAHTSSLSPSNSISVRMAQPSSSHHRDERSHSHRSERERSHHHHRTISSTTLLLVLSLILAVLAVMLSLPIAKAPVGLLGTQLLRVSGIT